MWIKIVYDEDDLVQRRNRPKNLSVAIENSEIAPVPSDFKSFRLSRIFPLNGSSNKINLENSKISFFNYVNAYRILGIINKIGSQSLKEHVSYSIGLSSIILIYDNKDILKEFKNLIEPKAYAFEHWTIKNSKITNIEYYLNKENNPVHLSKVIKYAMLKSSYRVLIDEFIASIRLFEIKMAFHMPSETNKVNYLVKEINELITELIYLETFSQNPPESLSEYDISDLKDTKLGNVIKNQIIDRIIQINSALSLVSTQGFSGAIPILERRSIIRRYSLLGIGSAITALNRIYNYIENIFLTFNIENTINSSMKTAKPLEGLKIFPQYDSSTWRNSNIDIFDNSKQSRESYIKLPFFSGRHGFRESEYSISAPIQAITHGADRNWSLMTITHEILHGYVRLMINTIFNGSNSKKEEENWNDFFKSFENHTNKKTDDFHLIDSVRNIIFSYCQTTLTYGSITNIIPAEYSQSKFKVKIKKLLDEDFLWKIFEAEYRNINEIFVHVLDLHYFYAGRVSLYIPLIWSTWIKVPHVCGNIRQYILRSLLVIASKIDNTPLKRFNIAKERLVSLLEPYSDSEGKLKDPIILEVLKELKNTERMNKYYFLTFNASLILVDLVSKVFVSSEIAGELFNDELVEWIEDEEDEDSFERESLFII